MTPRADAVALQLATPVAARLQDALGSNLVAIYLHGSAVLGGFSTSVSDLDILVLCENPMSDAEVEAVVTDLEQLDLPSKGLEMSVLTRTEAREPDLLGPRYQLHVAVQAGTVRQVDGRPGETDRDLILHIAVCRAAGHALVGPAPAAMLPALPDATLARMMADEIRWARGAGDATYLVLTAARARAFARTRRLVSKVEAGELESGIPVVAAALARQRGPALPIDPGEAARFADAVEARLRADGALAAVGTTEVRPGAG